MTPLEIIFGLMALAGAVRWWRSAWANYYACQAGDRLREKLRTADQTIARLQKSVIDGTNTLRDMRRENQFLRSRQLDAVHPAPINPQPWRPVPHFAMPRAVSQEAGQ